MNTELLGRRNGAIDMLRGMTMFLMVAVNEFWTVLDVPHWLCHTGTYEDGMGLSDIVFPMFLFAMGMSIPYAVERRYAKGLSGESTLGHIISRSFALLVMGIFTVNGGSDFAPVFGYSRGFYYLIMLAGFFLVWNQYPKDFKWRKALVALGAACLLFLVLTYRTTDGSLMHASWWGILGLIGWAYLFCATVYVFCRRKLWALPLVWLALVVVDAVANPLRGGATLVASDNLITNFAQALHLSEGSSPLMAMGGVLLSLCDLQLRERSEWQRVGFGLTAALALLSLGVLSHQWWITSKDLGTLPWCFYVSALSVAVYTLLRVLEEHGLVRWFAPFRPAGTATLTVYMMPYIFLALWIFIWPSIPEWLCGWVGVAKCALFSLLCIWLAQLLVHFGIKLKI